MPRRPARPTRVRISAAIAALASALLACTVTLGPAAAAQTPTRHRAPDATTTRRAGIQVAAVAARTPTTQPPVWDLAGRPSPTAPTGELRDVQCFTATSCLAFGNRYDELAGTVVPMLQRWDGSTWSIVATRPVGHLTWSPTPQAFSCASADYCLGAFQDAPYLWFWDGSAAATIPVPAAQTRHPTRVTDVDCVTARQCLAVGYRDFVSRNGDETIRPVAGTWDGSAWTLKTLPGGPEILDALDCVSPASCIAVGQGGGLTFDGTSWTKLPTHAHTFTGVRCVGPNWCMALGDNGHTHAIAATWDGTRWHDVPVPEPAGGYWQTATDVACTTTTSCVMTGAHGGDIPQPRLWTWDGSAWTVVADGTAYATGSRGGFDGADCVASGCVVVGGRSFAFPGGGGRTTGALAATTIGGPWRALAPIVPTPPQDALLEAVSCPTDAFCAAVGTFTLGHSGAYAATYDGSTWDTQLLPQRDALEAVDVSCPSTTLCMAVGRKGFLARSPRPAGMLALRWTGAAWEPVPVRGLTTRQRHQVLISAVDCPTTRHCVAVGDTNYGAHPVIAQWHAGHPWTLHTATWPNHARFGTLADVSCNDTRSCTAVGQVNGQGRRYHGVTYRWSGRQAAWQVPAPLRTVDRSVLRAISCLPRHARCVAVGRWADGAPLVRRGGRWTLQLHATPTANLTRITCAAATGCVAVRSHYALLSWDGATWQRDGISKPPTYALPYDVSCSSSINCMAVGTSGPAVALSLRQPAPPR